MKTIKAYKTELKPNNKQASMLEGCCGYARFVYNWALAYWIDEYKRGEKRTGWMKLNTKLTVLKQADYKWMYEYPNCIREYAMRNCDSAYQNFFRNIKSGRNGKNGKQAGFPKFKKKKSAKQSFTIGNKDVKIESDRIRLGKLGWFRLKEKDYLPIAPEKIYNATVTKRGNRWYVSVQCDVEMPERKAQGEPVGVDVGIKSLAATSLGNYYENPKALQKAQEQLVRLNRELSRRKLGGKNRSKTQKKLAKLYWRIENIRKDALHKATSDILAIAKQDTERPRAVIIEDLNVKGMVKNHHIAQAVSDASFYEFRRQLEYKGNWYGTEVYVIDRFYPSSKTCSNCGAIHQDLKLSDRIFKCECGLEIDRDLNAAINILKFYTAKHAGINACRDGKVTDFGQCPSVKQEAGSGKLVNPVWLQTELSICGEAGC